MWRLECAQQGDRTDHNGTVIDEFMDMKRLECLHDGSSTGRGPKMRFDLRIGFMVPTLRHSCLQLTGVIVWGPNLKVGVRE